MTSTEATASLTAVGHGADQAGGEVVYSSDGLDPLPPPGVPPARRWAPTAFPQEEGAVLVQEATEFLSPGQAFEVFAGKIYPSSSASSSRVPFGENVVEIPAVQLARLSAELQALEKQLSSPPLTGDPDREGQVDGSAYATQLQALQEQYNRTQSLWRGRMDLLQNVLDTSRQGLMQSSVSSRDASSSTESPSTTTTADMTAQWETRLQRLEQLLGSPNASTASSTGWLDRLQGLEKILVKMEDEKQADLWQKRAKVIRQDLEAAAKARSKLLMNSSSSSSSSSSTAAAQDAKMLADLYDANVQLQGLAPHLPALVQRLHTLAHVHTDATTWAARLAATEQGLQQLATQAATLQQTVAKLEQGLMENVTHMQANLERLQKATP